MEESAAGLFRTTGLRDWWCLGLRSTVGAKPGAAPSSPIAVVARSSPSRIRACPSPPPSLLYFPNARQSSRQAQDGSSFCPSSISSSSTRTTCARYRRTVLSSFLSSRPDTLSSRLQLRLGRRTRLRHPSHLQQTPHAGPPASTVNLAIADRRAGRGKANRGGEGIQSRGGWEAGGGRT